MVVDLKYFNSLENEIESLQSQLETQRTQFLNKINRLSMEYYYVGYMNAILGVYTKLDDVTNLQCDYLEALEKCQSLKNELSKINTTSKSFEALQQHAINLELALQQSKNPIVVLISTREPKQTMNQSVATPLNKIVASEPTNQKPRSKTRKQYEHLVEINLFIVNSGCSKHMTGNLKLLNLVQGNVTIKRVYYVEGLNHNLFSVGQLCDAYFEVAFRKSTCYIRDLKGNDLLTDSRGTYLYSITLQNTTSPNPICLMAKASSSQAWFWHRRLSHLNFDTINLLSKYDIVIGLTKLKFIKYYLVLLVSWGKQNLRHSQHQMSWIFYLLLHGTTLVVSKSSFVHAVDAPDQRQQHNITLSTSTTVAADTPPLNIQTTPVTTSQAPTQEPTVTATENINQTETHEENAHVNEDEFINILSTPVHEQEETSS
ncbi:retrovirus-related pol polyprotein from transposon TNT 1-94 [Tanacetum coccineum]|uniref:Retrovirus-related pol polyprotein from transposon TNT 1-94 n=1 Tax=Tanacetum coccineum TaxID=301880 RepID=A0ABQ5GFY0_9ASTR